ncbi:hypothetical protein H1C71_004145, partial [Ictidomys tridecemlineatus]
VVEAAKRQWSSCYPQTRVLQGVLEIVSQHQGDERPGSEEGPPEAGRSAEKEGKLEAVAPAEARAENELPRTVQSPAGVSWGDCHPVLWRTPACRLLLHPWERPLHLGWGFADAKVLLHVESARGEPPMHV